MVAALVAALVAELVIMVVVVVEREAVVGVFEGIVVDVGVFAGIVVVEFVAESIVPNIPSNSRKNIGANQRMLSAIRYRFTFPFQA